MTEKQQQLAEDRLDLSNKVAVLSLFHGGIPVERQAALFDAVRTLLDSTEAVLRELEEQGEDQETAKLKKKPKQPNVDSQEPAQDGNADR